MPAPRICQFPFASALICRFAYSIYRDPFSVFPLCFPHRSLLCNNRLFFFILPYPIQIYPCTVSIHFHLVLCLYSGQIKHFMLYTVNTSLRSTGSYIPDRFPCNCVLLPCQFLKYALSDVPPMTDYLTDFRQQLSYQ